MVYSSSDVDPICCLLFLSFSKLFSTFYYNFPLHMFDWTPLVEHLFCVLIFFRCLHRYWSLFWRCFSSSFSVSTVFLKSSIFKYRSFYLVFVRYFIFLLNHDNNHVFSISWMHIILTLWSVSSIVSNNKLISNSGDKTVATTASTVNKSTGTQTTHF